MNLLFVAYALLLCIQVSNIFYLRRRVDDQAAEAGSDSLQPLVSILIPARNEEENLRRLIPSLLGQDYDRFEVIVYDDDSDDGTPAVLQSFADDRLQTLRGTGPPPGWVGKVHALCQAAMKARGELYLFLDADTELLDPAALRRLVDRFETLGRLYRPPSTSIREHVLTGFTDLRGRGRLLVSLVPHTIITFLPAFLAERSSNPALGSLNGQCWMIDAATYERLVPHEHVAGEVLEDVMIGRYLKSRGVTPVMVDVRREVAVYMYDSFAEAWRGFRKNAYLLLGGSVAVFVGWFTFYAFLFVAAPIIHLPFLGAVYVLKLVSDRAAGMPLWITILTPLAHLSGLALQLDSAVSHWSGRATWKGRNLS